METLRQACPSCGRMLELPAHAAGRLAKCPACQATFTAQGDLPSESALPPYGAVPREDDAGVGSAAGAGQASNPFTSPLDAGTAAPVPTNPYLPTQAPDPVASSGELQIVPLSIDNVASPTLSIFGARWGPLLLAFIIALVAILGFCVIPAAVLLAIAQSGSFNLALLGSLFVAPLMLLVGAYISVGMARNAIAVARNSPSPLMEMFPPLSLVVRFLVGGLVLLLAGAAVVAVFCGLVATVLSVIGNQAAFGLTAIGVLVGSVLAMAVYWVLWAWVFIVSDGKGTVLGSIRAAYVVTMHNKLASLLLVVIATVLSTVGTSLCYVGLLITQPLTNLLFAVAYLLMTNQRIDDPRDATPSDQAGSSTAQSMPGQDDAWL